MTPLDDIMVWYGYFNLVFLPILLLVIREFRTIVDKIAEAKADDGKVDIIEILVILEDTVFGFSRIIQSTIDKLKTKPSP